MDLMRLITREESIGGLEITDTSVRAGFISRSKKSKGHLLCIEEPLPPETIENGTVKNPEMLIASLKRLLARAEGTSYFVVSIPPQRIYSKVLSFPGVITGHRLEEAVELSLGFQIPFKSEDAYIDSEITLKEDTHQVSVSAAKHSVIDAYTEALSISGVRAVAIESHHLSIARMIVPSDTPILTSIQYSHERVICVFDHGMVRLLRSLPLSHFATDTAMQEETERIKNFYAVEHAATPHEVALSQVPVELGAIGNPAPDIRVNEWLACLGAVKRGQIPRRLDKLVSLLPVGTELAYEYQKAIAFGAFMQTTVIGLGVFFIAAHLGVWGLMFSLKNNLLSAETVAISPNGGTLSEESLIIQFNELLAIGSTLITESPKWSPTIEHFNTVVGGDITITNFSIGGGDPKIQIAGRAKNRAALNAFKERLIAEKDFTDVELPLTNLELREDVPFTMSMSVRSSLEQNTL